MRAGDSVRVRAAPLHTGGAAGPGLDARPSSPTGLAGTVAAWRSWSDLHQTLRRPVARPGAPQRPGAAGADVPAQRRDRRRRDDVAAGGRRAANATGTTATPGCATRASRWRRCGWPPARTRPSDFFAFMTTAAAAAVGPGYPAADHVRRRRRARPDRADAAAPARLARQPAGAGRQRRLEPAADRRVRRAARRGAPAGRPDHRRSTTTCASFLVALADTAAEPLAGDRPGHLGGPRRAAALPATRR